jgi:uridylate kinase
MTNLAVLSLGGSLVVPDEVDTTYLAELRRFLVSHLETHPESRLVLVVGGGRPARQYQAAARSVCPDISADELDWTGIFATRLNARLVKAILGSYCEDPIVEDPTAVYRFTGRILVASGWKPGFSTDFDAVILAEEFGADFVVNMTNIDMVYTADPKIDPTATPIERIGWRDFLELTGETWSPGKNVPFDPVASKHASSIGLTVISANGKNLENLANILEGRRYVGTTITDNPLTRTT